MAATGSVLLLLLLLSSLTDVRASVRDDWMDYLRDGVLRMLDSRTKRDTEPSRNVTSSRNIRANFTFDYCGEADDAFSMTFFKVEPNPVGFPGDLDLTFGLNIKENATGPVKATMVMSKKVSLLFGLETWLDIPCLNDVIGSCTFEDICEEPVLLDGLCWKDPKQKTKSCGCPFVQGNYTTEPVRYHVPAIPDDFPSYLLRGEFYIKAVLSKEDRQLLCASATVYIDV